MTWDGGARGLMTRLAPPPVQVRKTDVETIMGDCNVGDEESGH